MLTYIARRLILLAPVLLGISVLTFTLMRLIPGDPVAIMLRGEARSAQDVEQIREQWGLNQPAILQYVSYLRHLLIGDFGRSFMRQQAVLPVILEYLPATIDWQSSV